MPIIKVGMDISGLKSGASQAASVLKGVSSSAADAAKNTGILAASITKVAAQVLALVGAYKALDSIKFFAQRGLEFNKTTEKTQAAVGAMVSSMAQLETEQGKLLTGAEKYAAAQNVAADMLQEVQRAAMSSSVPVEQLVTSMQDITDTALQAGVKLKQIPQFTVAASEAMQKLGIPVTQIRAEMDAILTGNVKKSKGFAQFLEIDQKTVNSWKNQGTYIENVLDRLKKYQGTSGNVAQTLEGATTSLKNTITSLSGDMTKGLNDSLKESVKSLQSLFVTSKDGTSELSKDFANVAVVIEQAQSSIGDTILSLTQTFTAAVRGLNQAIGSGAAADTFDSVKTAVYALAAAFTTLKVVRSDTLRQTKEATANWIQYRDAVSSGKAVVLGSAEAHRQQAAATVEAAKAENEAAQAALAEARAQVRSANAKVITATNSRELEKATKAQKIAQEGLTNAETRAKVTSDALAMAQTRLEVATEKAEKALTLKGRALALFTAAGNRAKAAISGLWAAMGGGVGVALTAITTGLAYLSTRQTETERSTRLLQEAQEAYARATKDAVDETGRLVRKLDDVRAAEVSVSQTKLLPDYDKQIERISKNISNAIQRNELDMKSFAKTPVLINGELAKAVPKKFIDDLNQIRLNLRDTKDANAFAASIRTLRDSLIQEGYGKSAIVKMIDEIIGGEDKLLRTLVSSQQTIKENEELLNSNANAYKEAEKATTDYKKVLDLLESSQKTQINDEKDAVEWLQKRTQGTKTMRNAIEENAKATDQLALAKIREAEAIATAEYIVAQYTATLNKNDAASADAVAAAKQRMEDLGKARAQYEKGLEEAGKNFGGKGGAGGGGRGGASQIESARESIKRLQEEISRLNGEMSKEGGALAKKTAEIEKLGKQAKMSGAEIEKLKKEYSAAFKADTLKEFDKAVLNLEGDTKALRELEIAQTLKDWGLKLHDIGMNADEAAPYLNRLKAALEQQEAYKDLQVTADFYKDLAQLSGEYGESIEYQNKLIDEQEKAWIKAGIPLEDVEKRVALMRQELSRDMFSGLVRGVRKFGAEYGDMASQVEGFTTQMGSHISNTLADAFMKGKFSAQDFFSSLISMAAQAASNAFIGQIFSGIGGLFSGGAVSGQVVGYTQAGAGGGFTGPLTASVGRWHNGGMVEKGGETFKSPVPVWAFAGAPRFHSGGGYFGSDEFPAILLRGERVLNRRETAAYNAGQAAALPAGKQDVTVNVINQTRQNVQAQTDARQDANGALNLDIVIKQVDSSMAGLARQGKSAFGKYIRDAYGLDRASTIMNGRGRA